MTPTAGRSSIQAVAVEARRRAIGHAETMERLSADDTRILRLESDAIAGHTLKLAIVEPAPRRVPLTVERVRNRVEARLGHLPRARQRLAPTPLRLAAPAWVDDSDFDIRNHVRRRCRRR